MLFTFLYHQWLHFWRSRNANKSLALQIILGLFYLVIFVEIALTGILLPYLLHEKLPNQNPITVFTSYILYYFMVGIVLRFQIQELPTLSIQPYLTQPVSRKSMLRFLNIRSLLHIINILPLFVFIPFSLVEIAPAFGTNTALCFIIAMLALVINNHFLNMLIKRKSVNSTGWFIAMMLTIVALKAADFFNLWSLEQVSSRLFTAMLHHPVFLLVPVALATTTFLLNNQYLRRHLYLEELVKQKNITTSTRYQYLNKWGAMGDMISLDLKLILRNKRPKSLLILSGVILLYGFLFYPKYLTTGNYSMIFLFALIITGLFISNYGQFLFAWQSNHFDGMMTYNLDLHQYIRAKFLLFVVVCSLQTLLASFYGLMDWHLIPIQIAAYLYGIGINSFVTIYTATFNYKYLNLTRSASMNFQGIGGMQWLQSLLISFGPALLFFGLYKLGGFWLAIGSISALGIGGLIFHQSIINWLVSRFNKRKMNMLEGFRER